MCTGSRNLSELSSSSVTLFFHWSKAKGNGNGGRLSSCLMVWEAASDWSKPYFSSTTHGGKRKLPEVAWSCTRLEEKLLITCCVFMRQCCLLFANIVKAVLNCLLNSHIHQFLASMWKLCTMQDSCPFGTLKTDPYCCTKVSSNHSNSRYQAMDTRAFEPSEW